ncbi:major facilitator superfamily transporter [Metarhizium brunneum]
MAVRSQHSSRPQANTTRFYLSIAAILVSNFMTAVDASLSSSAHVAVASHFNRTNVSTWPVTAFLVCSITVQPLYASLSDCIGRKAIYLSCAALFLLGIGLAAAAPSWTCLILARCVCGLASSGLTIMGSVVLTDLVGVKKRGYYQSMNYVNFGSASALGSVSGGTIVDRFGWSWLYKIQLPFALVTLVMVCFFIPWTIEGSEDTSSRDETTEGRRLLSLFDWTGALVLVISLLLLVFVLGTAGNVLPWTNPFVLLALFLFPCTVYALVRVEVNAQKPVLPPVLVQFPFRNIMINAFFLSIINYIVMYNVTFFFQAVLLETPGQASTHLVAPSIAFTIVSAISGATIARLETPKPTLRISQVMLLCGAAGLMVMATILPRTETPGALYNLCLAMPILGVGMMAPSALLLLLGMSDRNNHATLNGGFIMMRSLGGFTATSISTTIVQNVFQQTMRPFMTSEEIKKKIDSVRLNMDNLQTLEEPLRAQVVNAYRTGFIVLFGLVITLSVLIIFGFIGVSDGQVVQEAPDTAEPGSVTEMEDLMGDADDSDG